MIAHEGMAMAHSGAALVVPVDACALLDDQCPRHPHVPSVRRSDLNTMSGAKMIGGISPPKAGSRSRDPFHRPPNERIHTRTRRRRSKQAGGVGGCPERVR
jgi:hypothetical protein